jgi:hypothetical protein
VNDACGNRIIGPTIWTDDGRCAVCGYVPKMGNRRTDSSKRNWIRFCRVQHEAKHQRPAPPEKEKTDSCRDRRRWERYQSRDVNGLFEPEDEILGGCLAHREEYELTQDFPGMPDPPASPISGGCPACGYSMLGLRKTQRDRSAASGIAWANYEHPTFTRGHIDHAQRLARMSRGVSGPAEVTDRAPRALDEWANRMVDEARARMGRDRR